MTAVIALVASAAAGYLLGSCPNGLLVSRSHGLDIREHGSGNIGATNVLRVLGKKWGYLVFSLDALKGFAAVWIAFFFANKISPSALAEVMGITGGFFCILGHTFPIWLRFRGGKGVATSAGVLLGLMPLAMLSVLAVWIALFYATCYVSVSSILAAVTLPAFVLLYLKLNVIAEPVLFPFSILIAGVVVWRHRSNMRRLLHGTEERFGTK
jgi:acyl phosphate:glycerol-3-phosphate acyltransferase